MEVTVGSVDNIKKRRLPSVVEVPVDIIDWKWIILMEIYALDVGAILKYGCGCRWC